MIKGSSELSGWRTSLWSIAMLLISQMWLSGPASASAVNCEETPHTRIESSICGAPALRALDQELAAAVERAVAGNKLDRVQVTELRNGIARLCWREVDEKLQACLLDAELDAFQWVATRLGEPHGDTTTLESEEAVGIPRLSAAHNQAALKTKKLKDDNVVARRIARLERQLVIAESSLRRTGNTDLTVATIAELLDTLQQQKDQLPAERELQYSVAQLVQRMVQGCRQYQKKWRASLHQHELSCAEFSQRLPLIATSEFY